MMYGYSFGLGPLMMLLTVFLVAAVVWLLLRQGGSHIRGNDDPASALRVLEDRLARGDIDAEDFRVRRAAIADAKS